MARNMMIIAACDQCGVRGSEEDFAMDVVIDVPTLMKKPRETDLCTDRMIEGEDCFNKFVAAIQPFLDKTRPADAVSRAPKPERPRVPRAASAEIADPSVVCDVPGCVKGPNKGPYIAPTPLGLKMHKVRTHGAPKTNGKKRKTPAAE